MGGDVIKQFLVGLGFGVDDSSLAKFNKALKDATIKVTALYAATQVMAAGIFKSITSISDGFEQMGYEYRIIAPAINKALVLRNELLKAYKAANINITQVVQQSVKFNMALAKTKFALQAIYQSVGAKFFPLLTKQMDIFRGNIYKNMPRIQEMLEKFVKFVFKAFEATTILGARIWSILQRIYDFFYKLHEATSGWSTLIIGAIAAWKLLNLSFLATPFGMILAGLTALIALWDDFMTFKEGGESFINWGSDTTKMIVGLVAAVSALAAAFYLVRGAIVAYNIAAALIAPILAAAKIAMFAFNLVAAANPIGLIVLAVMALIAAITILIVKWDAIKSAIGGFFSGIGSKVMDFLGGSGGGAGISGSPLGVNNASNSQTNQNVQQQTQINVMGSADAGMVGKQVANEQSRVNYDMVRNLTGATR